MTLFLGLVADSDSLGLEKKPGSGRGRETDEEVVDVQVKGMEAALMPFKARDIIDTTPREGALL